MTRSSSDHGKSAHNNNFFEKGALGLLFGYAVASGRLLTLRFGFVLERAHADFAANNTFFRII